MLCFLSCSFRVVSPSVRLVCGSRRSVDFSSRAEPASKETQVPQNHSAKGSARSNANRVDMCRLHRNANREELGEQPNFNYQGLLFFPRALPSTQPSPWPVGAGATRTSTNGKWAGHNWCEAALLDGTSQLRKSDSKGPNRGPLETDESLGNLGLIISTVSRGSQSKRVDVTGCGGSCPPSGVFTAMQNSTKPVPGCGAGNCPVSSVDFVGSQRCSILRQSKNPTSQHPPLVLMNRQIR